MTLEDIPAHEIAPGSDESPPSTAPLQIAVSRAAEPRIVVLEGELDLSSAPSLQAEFAAALEDLESDLVLDIGALSFIDSSGLAMFVTLDKSLQSRGANLIISNPTPSVRRLFQITSLEDVLEIRQTDNP
jgi:anti-sigma B factor antagonist